MEHIGEGEHTNDELTKKYEEMGSWATFTSSSKIEAAHEPHNRNQGKRLWPL